MNEIVADAPIVVAPVAIEVVTKDATTSVETPISTAPATVAVETQGTNGTLPFDDDSGALN
jgi:hypothetical protein